jgi:LPS sulfotransferase NodH
VTGPRLLDPRNAETFDLPPPDLPERTYVVASLPRTGSTLLCNALWDTGLAGAPKEYLNPMQIRDWEVRFPSHPLGRLAHAPLVGPAVGLAGRGRWTDERLAAYLARIRARRTGANGWFGLKIHWHHFERWFVGAGRDPAAWLPATRWVLVTRREHTRQAVSWAKAERTNRWAAWQRPWLPPLLTRRAVEAKRTEIERGEAAWDAWFAAAQIAPFRLTYEDLVARWDGSLRDVLRFLDVSADPSAALPGPSLTPQADAHTERWVASLGAGE